MKRIFIAVCLCVVMVLSACSTGQIRSESTKDVASSLTSTEKIEPTEEPTQAVTPSPTPTPVPTPMTESVFIPGEELPDGQLFEEEYFAVFPEAGGNKFSVYDSFGKIIHSFRYSGDSNPPIGIVEKSEVEKITSVPDSGQGSAKDSYLYSFPGGHVTAPDLSSIAEDYLWIITDKGETIHVKGNSTYMSSSGIVSFDDSTGVCALFLNGSGGPESFLSLHYVRIHADGSVVTNLEIDDLAIGPIQIVGEKYVVFYKYDEEGDATWYLADLSGNILMEDVDPILLNMATYLPQGMGSVYVYDYFMKDGKVYDAQLNPVPDDTRSPDGRLIPGVKYNVDGISCEVLDGFEEGGFSDFGISYANGRDESGAIAIKSDWGDCVIRGVEDIDVRVYGVNSSLVLLSNHSLYSLKTGEYVANLLFRGNVQEPRCVLTDEYLLACYDPGFYIVDNDGNLRYFSETEMAEPTDGKYFLLINETEFGIADLNGEWVLKPN